MHVQSIELQCCYSQALLSISNIQRFVVANRLSVQILGAKVAWGGGKGERGRANTAGVPHDNLQGERRLIFLKTPLSCAGQPHCQFAYGLSA